jgi:hypothetical protein
VAAYLRPEANEGGTPSFRGQRQQEERRTEVLDEADPGTRHQAGPPSQSFDGCNTQDRGAEGIGQASSSASGHGCTQQGHAKNRCSRIKKDRARAEERTTNSDPTHCRCPQGSLARS